VTGSAIALSLPEPPLINASLGRGPRSSDAGITDLPTRSFGVAALHPEYLVKVDAIALLDA
jgi:hypothetical protein